MPDTAATLGLLRTSIDQFLQGCEQAFIASIVQLLNDLKTVNAKNFKLLGCKDSEDIRKLLMLHFNRVLRHETTDVSELNSALLDVFTSSMLALALIKHVPRLTVRAAVTQEFLQHCENAPDTFSAKEFLILRGMLHELRDAYDDYKQWIADYDKLKTLTPLTANAHWDAISARFEQLGKAVGADDGETKKISKDTTKKIKKDE